MIFYAALSHFYRIFTGFVQRSQIIFPSFQQSFTWSFLPYTLRVITSQKTVRPSEKILTTLVFLYLVNICQENKLSQVNMLNYRFNITYICLIANNINPIGDDHTLVFKIYWILSKNQNSA